MQKLVLIVFIQHYFNMALAALITIITTVVIVFVLVAIHIVYQRGKVERIKQGIVFVYDDMGQTKCIWDGLDDIKTHLKIIEKLQPIYCELWINGNFIKRVDCRDYSSTMAKLLVRMGYLKK